MVSPHVWRLTRDRADEQRRLLVRAWWLILGLILVVATIFHALGSDTFPWMFPFAVVLGIACWMLALAWAHGYYLLMRHCAKRSERREADRAAAGR
ncbi:MAG TPA: hypothetical protein VGR35_00915 [Tepidisphaeraceae bacterium]|nr:hypothetical protein [Tepidisphaeraceae bacterium]